MEFKALRSPTLSLRPLAGHERHTALQQLAAVRSSRDRPGSFIALQRLQQRCEGRATGLR